MIKVAKTFAHNVAVLCFSAATMPGASKESRSNLARAIFTTCAPILDQMCTSEGLDPKEVTDEAFQAVDAMVKERENKE